MFRRNSKDRERLSVQRAQSRICEICQGLRASRLRSKTSAIGVLRVIYEVLRICQ